MNCSIVTYSPEDNKLRLYVGRVPRDEYETLRDAGFVSTPKQDCDFVATWSPQREDLAREYLEDGEDIGDEDYSPEERAADKAERLSGYRDSRMGEAVGSADAYAAGGQVFGHQSRARAERQARRHDRSRTYAVSQWSKAEYWQSRTEGVIRHALYKSSASVRRGRILTLEAELRKIVASYTPADNPPHIINQRGGYLNDGAEVPHVWVGPKGRGGNWVPLASLEARKLGYARWVAHYELRLSYERAMLAAEGGSVTEADIEPGGWIAGGRSHCLEDGGRGWRQVQKVNKSPSTGRVVSVQVWGTWTGFTKESDYTRQETKPALVTINVERLGENAYRAPTEDERTTFAAANKQRKAEAKASKPATIPLINPTLEDANAIQAIWNERALAKHNARSDAKWIKDFEPLEVVKMTQAQYSALSKGDYAKCETRTIHAGGMLSRKSSNMWTSDGAAYDKKLGPALCKVRIYGYDARIIHITDKPAKPLPMAVIMEAASAIEPVEVA